MSAVVCVLCAAAGIENMSSAALCELYDEMDSLVRELSEELVLELARRDELEYEKELKNQFISLLLSVQRRHRALVDSKLRGGSAAGSSKAKDTPCTGSSQPGCVSLDVLFSVTVLYLLLNDCHFIISLNVDILNSNSSYCVSSVVDKGCQFSVCEKKFNFSTDCCLLICCDLTCR